MTQASWAPRYSMLALCIRAGLYGWHSQIVTHMLERMHHIATMDFDEDLFRALMCIRGSFALHDVTGAEAWLKWVGEIGDAP